MTRQGRLAGVHGRAADCQVPQPGDSTREGSVKAGERW